MNHTAKNTKSTVRSPSSKKSGFIAKSLKTAGVNDLFSPSILKGVMNATKKNKGKALFLGQVAIAVGGAYLLWSNRNKIMRFIEAAGIPEFFSNQIAKVSGEHGFLKNFTSTESPNISTESSRSRAV